MYKSRHRQEVIFEGSFTHTRRFAAQHYPNRMEAVAQIIDNAGSDQPQWVAQCTLTTNLAVSMR